MVDWEKERELNKARGEYAREHPALDINEMLQEKPQSNLDALRTAGKKGVNGKTAYPKLEAAKAQATKTVEGCRVAVQGLHAKRAEYKQFLEDLPLPHGFMEHLMSGAAGFGSGWAKRKLEDARQNRLEHTDLKSLIEDLGEITKEAIAGLGRTESEHREIVTGLQREVDREQIRLEAANPQYLAIKEVREGLEKAVQEFEPKLAACTQAERPKVEADYEALKRKRHEAAEKEKDLLAVVMEAQRGLSDNGAIRDSSAYVIEFVHAMRQQLLEQFLNDRFAMEHAIAALRAQAHIQDFADVHSSRNTVMANIKQLFSANAGAAGEVWDARIRKAAQDPDEALKLIQQMLIDAQQAQEHLLQIEGQMEKGERMPLIEAREKVAAATPHREQENANQLEVDSAESFDSGETADSRKM